MRTSEISHEGLPTCLINCLTHHVCIILSTPTQSMATSLISTCRGVATAAHHRVNDNTHIWVSRYGRRHDRNRRNATTESQAQRLDVATPCIGQEFQRDECATHLYIGAQSGIGGIGNGVLILKPAASPRQFVGHQVVGANRLSSQYGTPGSASPCRSASSAVGAEPARPKES